MGIIRKSVRAASFMTVGVPLAHKRSKKDKIVRNTGQMAEQMRRQNQMLAAQPQPTPAAWVPTPPPTMPPPPPVDAAVTYSVADELEKLASLHQQGYLSDAEFEAQKARLLQS